MEKETEIGQRRKSILVLRGRFRSAGSAMTGGGHRVKGESAAEEMRTAEVPHTITLGGGRKWLSGRIRTGGERGGKSVTGGGQKKGPFRLSTPFYEDHLQTGKKEGLCVCSCVLLHRLRKVLGTQTRRRKKRRRQRHRVTMAQKRVSSSPLPLFLPRVIKVAGLRVGSKEGRTLIAVTNGEKEGGRRKGLLWSGRKKVEDGGGIGAL